MARVTVEDCIEHVENRFELVILAAQRAKQISAGSPLTVDRDNDKDAVVALREIADTTVQTPDLREDLTVHFQRRQAADAIESTPFAGEADETDETADSEVAELMAEESSLAPASDAEETAEMPEGMDFADNEEEIED